MLANRKVAVPSGKRLGVPEKQSGDEATLPSGKKPRRTSARAAVILAAAVLALATTSVAFAQPPAMHIAEGFLPPVWAAVWFAATIPFWLVGFRRIGTIVAERPEARVLLGLSAAFAFVLSALKMPSATGSSSHPTGTGLGAILFGPTVMTVLASIVLVFQALLLAHGGLTTLGANTFSMGVAGPVVAWAVWRTLSGRAPVWLAALLAAALADVATYLVTSAQLALAFPDPVSGFAASFVKFATVFAVTQAPLALSEGLLTVIILRSLQSVASAELSSLATALSGRPAR